MKVTLVVLSAILAVTFGDPIAIRPCGDVHSVSFSSIDVSGCDSSKVCEVKRGSNVTVKTTFKTGEAYNFYRNGVYGLIGGIELPFPGFEARDLCSMLVNGTKCPIPINVDETEAITLSISSSFPPVKATVEWKIFNEDPSTPKDDKTKIVGCTEFILQLV